jgi:uncharacterized protein
LKPVSTAACSAVRNLDGTPALHFTLNQHIRENSLWIRPTQTVQVCPDPDDNIFLECAQAAQADYLGTGNLKHFPATWPGTQIVTPRQFLDIFS